MAKQKGGNAHNRAVAKTPKNQEPRDQSVRQFLSNGWVIGIVLGVVFLVASIFATEMFARWKASRIPTIKVTPTEITYGVPKTGAINAFSDSYNFKFANTTDQDVYNVFVKLLVDTTSVSLYDFGLKVEQSGMKPIDPDTPNGQKVGDVLDAGCFDASNRVVFLIFMPHLEPNGHRELSLTYMNDDYSKGSVSPTTRTLTLPDSTHGFTVRPQVMQFTKDPTPIHRSANGEYFQLGTLDQSLKCYPTTATSLSQ
jgi:hypothetical protein